MWYEHEITVIPVTRFPIDMLRYDRCFPATEIDARRIESSLAGHELFDHETEFIVLKAYSRATTEHWTEGRWISFGCRILKKVTQRLTL